MYKVILSRNKYTINMFTPIPTYLIFNLQNQVGIIYNTTEQIKKNVSNSNWYKKYFLSKYSLFWMSFKDGNGVI